MSATNGPILPTADILNDYEHGKFVLSNLAAKRAKQLREGAPPLVRVDSHHPLTVALAEIAAGKIKAIFPKEDLTSAAVEGDLSAALVEEAVPGELGILLPALDDLEAELVGVGALLGDDHDDEEHHADDAPSLSDLLEDATGEPEPERETVEPEADTLSLSDIEAEEEVAEADDDDLD